MGSARAFRRLLPALVCALSIGRLAAATEPVPVTACGQAVERSGVLGADLDCSGSTGPAVVLRRGAKLSLAGFTLTASEVGVRCDVGRCEVSGPGAIRRPTYAPSSETIGIFAAGAVRVRGNVQLENWRIGVYGLGSTRVTGATVVGCSVGALGGPIRIADSAFTGNGTGVMGSSATRDGIHYAFRAPSIVRSAFSANGVDIGSFKRPGVHHTVCSTSARLTIPPTPYSGGDEWGVCS